ncbi:MAG: reverse transcriptase domain-containing protein [Exilibacterium sp.]
MLREEFELPSGLLNFVNGYLSGRKMRVRVGESLSDEIPVVSGVPQGSILGPLLFDAYINRVANVELSKSARVIMYADDLVYLKPLHENGSEKEMEADIARIESAFQCLALKLNAKKCKVMQMSASKQAFEMNIKISGTKLEVVDSYRYLGVHLDSQMTFSEHTRVTVTKVRQALGALVRTTRKWAPRKTFGKIYKGTLEPIMLYASDVCYPSQAGLQHSLERVHRYAARLASNNFIDEYSEILQSLGWKSFQQLATERSLTLLWSYCNGKRTAPQGVFERDGVGLRRSTRTGNGMTLALPQTTLAHVQASALNQAKRLWNALTTEEVSCTTKKRFKKSLESNKVFNRLKDRGLVRSL